MSYHEKRTIDGVEFNFVGGILASVVYDQWPFPVENGALGYPGGYPLPESMHDELLSKGRTGKQLNEEMLLAREICELAYQKHLASAPSN